MYHQPNINFQESEHHLGQLHTCRGQKGPLTSEKEYMLCTQQTKLKFLEETLLLSTKHPSPAQHVEDLRVV